MKFKRGMKVRVNDSFNFDELSQADYIGEEGIIIRVNKHSFYNIKVKFNNDYLEEEIMYFEEGELSVLENHIRKVI